MKKILIPILLAMASVASAQSLTLKWSTDSLLRVPESVLYDAGRNVLYVANIDGAPDGKDGEGFISQVATDGKIKNLKWVTGLDAPKGLGMYKNNLYVADLTRVVVIDIPTGKISKTIEAPGAVFLNDITVDSKGIVYVSDTRGGKIYRITNGAIEVYLEQEDLMGVNGLLVIKDGLYVLNFAAGSSYKLTADKKLTKIGETAQGADGVVAVGNGDYIVSNWHGAIYYVKATGEATKILDTTEAKIGAADIDYNQKTKMLYVPTFFKNTIMAYELKLN